MTATAPNRLINNKAALWTACVHAALLLLFVLWRYTIPPAPLPIQEGGIEVNLGTSDEGSGNQQPQDPDAPAAASARASRSAMSAASLPDMARDADNDNPSVNTSTRTSQGAADNAAHQRSAQNTSQQNAQATAQQRPRFVYTGANGKGGNSAMSAVPGGAEGDRQGNGDRGVPNGMPGAKNYTGTPGNGNMGFSSSMAGRTLVAFPAREAEFNHGGKVVLQITVNRDGNITEASVKSSNNHELDPIALRKVRSARYNKNPGASQEQFGTITFDFHAGR